jgi:transcriptional regulator with XRE-family HTH domain
MVNRSSSKSAPRRSGSRFTREYQILLGGLIQSRKAAGVTPIEVAQWLGKPQSHVSKIETGERELSMVDLWKWCAAIGLPVSELVRQFEVAIGPFQKPGGADADNLPPQARSGAQRRR